jgi:hypothetical protein
MIIIIDRVPNDSLQSNMYVYGVDLDVEIVWVM